MAKLIHAAEHYRDRDLIASKLKGLDRLFHHVEQDVSHWTAHRHRRVGMLSLDMKMEYIESTLHHLMRDVGVKRQVKMVDYEDSAPAPYPE